MLVRFAPAHPGRGLVALALLMALTACIRHPDNRDVSPSDGGTPAKIPSFGACSTSSQCVDNDLCVDWTRTGRPLCKPICTSDADCASLPYDDIACRLVYRMDGELDPRMVCDQGVTYLYDGNASTGPGTSQKDDGGNCSADGADCATAADCCSGNCGAEGRCAPKPGGNCSPTGDPCNADESCCSGFCDQLNFVCG